MANASNAGAVYGVTFFLIGLPAYGSAAGTIGAAAQIVFATFPVVQVWRRQARGDKIAAEMSGGIL